MGKISKSGLGIGIGSSPQESLIQTDLDLKIIKLSTLMSYLMKNRIHPHSLPIKHIPNSTIKQYDDHGKLIRIRHYNEKGNAYKDVDYTDHGRPDVHKVPHTHIIEIGNVINRKKGVLPYEYK